MKCQIEDCNSQSKASGFCYKHYARFRKHGDANFVSPHFVKPDSIAKTFQNHFVVNSKSGCWEWQRASDDLGYGRLCVNGKMILAHRFSYEMVMGVIGCGLELDHKCRNPKCVNPDHLEAVTHKINVQRGLGNGLKHITHCKNGHEFTIQNTIKRPNNRRGCRECKKISSRNLYRKKAGIELNAPPQKRGPKKCQQQH